MNADPMFSTADSTAFLVNLRVLISSLFDLLTSLEVIVLADAMTIACPRCLGFFDKIQEERLQSFIIDIAFHPL